MIPAWKDFLLDQGAVLDGDRVEHFSDIRVELSAVRNQAVLADVSNSALLVASGEDAASFLHGQFTNDVLKLAAGRLQWNGYCSPKGRLLATFLLWKEGDHYLMQLPATVQEPVQKRLGMFVLRAKVKLADASTASIRLGLAGAGAAALIEEVCKVGAPAPRSLAGAEPITVLGLGENRYEIIAAGVEIAQRLWHALASHVVKVGAGRWDWLGIRAGEAQITKPTQEQFVPQMVNLDWLGGVNFRKGCYPGQEIVARTQYLGRLKRRMYLVNIDTEGAAAGDELFSPDLEGQACGMLVDAAPSPDGGIDALAVMQIESALNQPVHFQSPTGPLARLLPLPYALP